MTRARAMDVTVNGIAIPSAAIAAEAQHHPSASAGAAREAATGALVIRELLLQEAGRLGLRPDPAEDGEGRRESDEDSLIRLLLAREIKTPRADESVCRRYYEQNRERFRSADLYEAAHILFAAPPEDEAAYARAVARAEAAITVLAAEPAKFASLAREHSACPSAQSEGRLGQIARGDTVPEFETFLVALEEGQLCPVPVKTRYGAHVLRLDRRIAGRHVPFEDVRARIADYLEEASFRRAASQYIAVLAGRADIRGFDMRASDGPLVR